MRGIGHTLSRLPATRAFIAGAALLAGAMASVAHAQPLEPGNGDESAMALPRYATRGGSGVPLPHPLAPSDAILIRRVFTLQDRGRLSEAIRESDRINDNPLLGHVLAQRYLGPFYRTSAAELGDWLVRFADHPDASAIRELLVRRRPKGGSYKADQPAAPSDGSSLLPEGLTDPVPEDTDPTDRRIPRNPVLDRTVYERARDGHADAAMGLISRTPGLSAVYAMQLRAEVAQILFTQNRDKEAL